MQLSRHARRVYCGGLPAGISEVDLTTFINTAMLAAGGCIQPGPPVISCFMNADKRYAFIEFRSVAEASNAMAFDGIACQGETLKIRRPHDYNPQAAQSLGPMLPSPTMNLAALRVVGTQVEDGPNKIFIGGLPTGLTEDQVRELLQAFGPLKSYNLVTDRDTGASKGYAFCEYANPDMTEVALQGLSSINIMGKTLTVRRANSAINYLQSQAAKQAAGLTQAQQAMVQSAQAAICTAAGMPQQPPLQLQQPLSPAAAGNRASATPGSAGGGGPCVIRLANMVQREDLLDQDEYNELLDDTRTEVSKYGRLLSVVIPKPSPSGPAFDPPGVGLVFLRYQDHHSAEVARVALNGRTFGDETVMASFFDTQDFEASRLH